MVAKILHLAIKVTLLPNRYHGNRLIDNVLAPAEWSFTHEKQQSLYFHDVAESILVRDKSVFPSVLVNIVIMLAIIVSYISESDNKLKAVFQYDKRRDSSI